MKQLPFPGRRALEAPPRGNGATPLIRAALVAAVALSLVAPPAAAETFAQLWNEDFCDGSDWTIDADIEFNVPNSCAYQHSGATGAWQGPTYRSAAGSTWNPATHPVMKIKVENLVLARQSGTDNRQFGFGVDADHHVFDSTGNDFLEFRLVEDEGTPFIGWAVLWKDDGGSTHVNSHSTGVTIEQDPFPPPTWQLDANITVNIGAMRYWINWTLEDASGGDPGQSASITGLWTNDVDGPFAESTAFYLNLWSYSSSSGVPTWSLDDLTWFAVEGSAAPPPEEPEDHGEIHADYAWSTSAVGTQFFDRSEGPAQMAEWTWNFGDGYGSKRQYPFHTFMCRGNYTVVLQVVDAEGNKGDVSSEIFIPDDHPLCGILQRHEEGVTVNTGNQLLTIPQAFFVGVMVVSGLSLAMGIKVPYVSTEVRLLIFLVSLAMLLFTFGALAFLG